MDLNLVKCQGTYSESLGTTATTPLDSTSPITMVWLHRTPCFCIFTPSERFALFERSARSEYLLTEDGLFSPVTRLFIFPAVSTTSLAHGIIDPLQLPSEEFSSPVFPLLLPTLLEDRDVWPWLAWWRVMPHPCEGLGRVARAVLLVEESHERSWNLQSVEFVVLRYCASDLKLGVEPNNLL